MGAGQKIHIVQRPLLPRSSFIIHVASLNAMVCAAFLGLETQELSKFANKRLDDKPAGCFNCGRLAFFRSCIGLRGWLAK
jgi:hypothetical protein